MGLDALYGQGALAGFTAACAASGNNPTVTEGVEGADGTVYVSVEWNNALLVIACMPLRVHYIILQTVGGTLYQGLLANLPPFFKPRGVVQFSCAPSSEASKFALRNQALAGWYEGPSGGLLWDL